MNDNSSWLNVDFREIPQGNISNGDQDAFELFARDLLNAIGFKILKEPARGSDDRKDIIVSEIQRGIVGTSEIKYLVSCKHFAHTKNENKAVGNDKEPDVVGRMRNNGCKGFIGFYSTIASEALRRELVSSKGINQHEFTELIIFDKAKIVDLLHQNEKTIDIYKRYFPVSFKANSSYEMDSELYIHKPTIACAHCHCNLLENMFGKVINLVENKGKIRDGVPDWDYPIAYIKDILFSCDNCIQDVIENVDKKYKDWPFAIEKCDISSYTNPRFFIDELMRETNFIRTYNDRYTEMSYRTWNRFHRAMFYFVSRKVKKISSNSTFPDFNKFNL